MYGKSANVDLNESNVDKGMIVEYADLLEADDSGLKIDAPNTNIEITAAMVENEMIVKPTSEVLISNSTPTKAISEQIVTRRPDGKRRITPKFIPVGQDT